MKIAILGYSGSGKSTLARLLGESYEIPVLHLDTVQFEPNWQVRDCLEAQKIIKQFMIEHQQWVIDGNYSTFLQKERLNQADIIIYLNFSRWRCLYRVSKRYQKYRGTNRQDMTEGCEEKLDSEFIWWVLYEGRKKAARLHYKQLRHDYSEKFIEFKTPRQLTSWLTQQGIILDE
ncbi:DNA topology modulation protein [Vagococcus vulneris]|uniref:Topology modulation protein n=1 Tax=Vagococcus vulneris TaxID=1977869 RepID=A0A429ZX95_9ENTE|nr:DNA topology modulation protein [Vagococcus vulneris]RST98299.1 topology modulation protein [Vagococcus vulneris]